MKSRITIWFGLALIFVGVVINMEWIGTIFPQDEPLPFDATWDFRTFRIDMNDPTVAANIQIWGEGEGDVEHAIGLHSDLPSQDPFTVYHVIFPTQPSGTGQVLFKVDNLVQVSGRLDTDFLIESTADLDGQWLDIWTYYNLTINDNVWNGVPERWTFDISFAEDNGSGSPVAGTIITESWELLAAGANDGYVGYDTFVGALQNIDGWVPSLFAEANVSWTQQSGTWYKYNGSLVCEATGIATLNAPNADHTVTCMWEIDGAAEIGLVVRYVDANNYWLLRCLDPTASSPVLELAKIVNGSETIVDSITLTDNAISLRTPMRLEANGTNIYGEIPVEFPILDGGQLAASDDTFLTATNCGLYAEATGGVTPFTYEVVVNRSKAEFDPIVMSSAALESYKVDAGVSCNCNVFFHNNDAGGLSAPADSTCGYWDTSTVLYDRVMTYKSTPFEHGWFLCRIVPISGDTADLQLSNWESAQSPNTWFDLHSANIFIVAGSGETKSVTVSMTIAIDDGTGNPMTGTQTVTREITVTAVCTG